MNKIARLFIVGLILIFSFNSCGDDDNDPVTPPDNGGETETLPISKNNKVIYEVNIRNYSSQGNFSGLEKDLPRLKELGIDILWLMPIHPIGEENRIGTKGSPYSVKNYRTINPDYGNSANLKSLVSAAHAADMEIWLDWVANHTAWDHVWVTEHIDYYASKEGQRPYSPNGWNDVIQLDFSNQNMRNAMIEAMKYWVQEFDIDGFRCDYATGVPVDFWRSAKTEINKIKEITWLCEGDNSSYMNVFDFDYAWAFNTALNEFGKNNNVTQLRSACNTLFSSQYPRMVYLTNHDLSAYDGTEFTRYGSNVLTLAVLSFTIYDMPLIYNGQEIGMDKTMGLFDVNPVQWLPVNNTISNVYKKLIRLKRSQPALESGSNRGTLNFYQTDNEQVMVYSRKRDNNEVLVMLNFSKSPVSFQFTSSVPIGEFTDYLGSSGKQSFSTQTTINLSTNGYSVYVK